MSVKRAAGYSYGGRLAGRLLSTGQLHPPGAYDQNIVSYTGCCKHAYYATHRCVKSHGLAGCWPLRNLLTRGARFPIPRNALL